LVRAEQAARSNKKKKKEIEIPFSPQSKQISIQQQKHATSAEC